jgi:hypothetical protein
VRERMLASNAWDSRSHVWRYRDNAAVRRRYRSREISRERRRELREYQAADNSADYDCDMRHLGYWDDCHLCDADSLNLAALDTVDFNDGVYTA